MRCMLPAGLFAVAVLLIGCDEQPVLWSCNCPEAPTPKMCSVDEPVLVDANGQTLADCCGTVEEECECPNGENTCTCPTTTSCVEDGAF